MGQGARSQLWSHQGGVISSEIKIWILALSSSFLDEWSQGSLQFTQADDKIGNHGSDKGNWNVFYLFLHDMRFEDNCERCPKTVEIIEKVVPREYQ